MLPDDLARIEIALQVLRKAADFAQDAESERWEFAVELERLAQIGVTPCELRWMLKKGLILHARETTPDHGRQRAFSHHGASTFGKNSCFILGAAESSLLPTRDSTRDAAANGSPQNVSSLTLPATPVWDPQWRVLAVNNLTVKQFKVPAPNQETVLNCFQEEGWPARIDDPLSPHPDIDAKRRLHDTVSSLNRCQKNAMLRFEMDGTGEGVLWRFLAHGCQTNSISRAV